MEDFDSFDNKDEQEVFSNSTGSDDDEEEEVLTMSRVRFNSECILPSHLDSCSLNN